MGKFKKALDHEKQEEAEQHDGDDKDAFSEQFMERNLGVLFRVGDRGFPQILKIEAS